MTEVYNGGLSVKLGTYTLKIIGAYDVTWEQVTDGGFTNWDFTEIDGYQGMRFVVSISTKIPAAEKDKLMSALFKREFTIDCPDYKGNVKVTSLTQPVAHSNIFGTYYTVGFTAAATALTGGSGGL